MYQFFIKKIRRGRTYIYFLRMKKYHIVLYPRTILSELDLNDIKKSISQIALEGDSKCILFCRNHITFSLSRVEIVISHPITVAITALTIGQGNDFAKETRYRKRISWQADTQAVSRNRETTCRSTQEVGLACAQKFAYCWLESHVVADLAEFV